MPRASMCISCVDCCSICWYRLLASVWPLQPARSLLRHSRALAQVGSKPTATKLTALTSAVWTAARTSASPDAVMHTRVIRSCTSAVGSSPAAAAHAVRTLHQQAVAQPAVAALSMATGSVAHTVWHIRGPSSTLPAASWRMPMRGSVGRGTRLGAAPLQLHSQWRRHKSCGIIGLPNGQLSDDGEAAMTA